MEGGGGGNDDAVKNDAKAIPSRKGGAGRRLTHSVLRDDAAADGDLGENDTLVHRCRCVIVKELERFPPQSFDPCDEEEWETIIRLRHARTAPKEGSGGLDGTGRQVPAMTDKFMTELEEAVPHLAESKVVDELVWKDCVNYVFRLHGISRPRCLEYPWPVLAERVRRAGQVVADKTIETESAEFGNSLRQLQNFPMNVALLKETGIGKTVKKAAKMRNQHDELGKLLSAWKGLAASSGVRMDTSSTSAAAQAHAAATATVDADREADMALVERCQSWRQLFAGLRRREDKRRKSHAERMRENKKKQQQVRPKVVSVRPKGHASTKKERILAGRSAAHTWTSPKRDDGNAKMAQLREETAIQKVRQQRSSAATAASKRSGGFGDAVAFAASAKKSKRNRVNHVKLGSGKRMKVPTRVVQGAGAPRQLASKWKTIKK